MAVNSKNSLMRPVASKVVDEPMKDEDIMLDTTVSDDTAALPEIKMSDVEKQYYNGTSAIDPNMPYAFPEETETEYTTDTGEKISSAYGDAEDFYVAQNMNDIIDNTPSGAMSYENYLAYNGITDPRINYQKRAAAAAAAYARAGADYGRRAEALSQMGLSGSGYSEFLFGSAYGDYQSALSEAADIEASDNAELQASYRQYLADIELDGNTQVSDIYTYLLENAIGSDETALDKLRLDLSVLGYDAAAIDRAFTQFTERESIGTDNAEASDEDSITLSERETALYNMLIESGASASIIDQMRKNGYSESEIQRAQAAYDQTVNQSQLESANNVISEITADTYVLGGLSAAQLAEAYGNDSEAYKQALSALQDRNTEFYMALIDDTEGAAMAPRIAELYNADPVYGKTWEKLSAEKRGLYINDSINSAYKSGDLSKEQYDKLCVYYWASSANAAMQGTSGGATALALGNQVSKILDAKENGRISSEGVETLLDALAGEIRIKETSLRPSASAAPSDVSDGNALEMYVTIGGKTVRFKYELKDTEIKYTGKDGISYDGESPIATFDGKSYRIIGGKMITNHTDDFNEGLTEEAQAGLSIILYRAAAEGNISEQKAQTPNYKVNTPASGNSIKVPAPGASKITG